MIYIPIRSDAAANLSRAIYQLTRPPATRQAGDVSCYYCEWIQHPTREEVALVVMPDSETVPVHSSADGALLEETLAPFAGKELAPEEIAGVIAAVQSLAGQRVNVADIVQSTSWEKEIMTYEQALADGWIPQPPTIP